MKMLFIRLIFLGVMGVFMVMSNDVFGAELGDIHKDISSLMDRLDNIEVKFAHFEKNVGSVVTKIHKMDKKMDKLVGIASKLNTEVGEVTTQVGDVTKQVGEVKTHVGDVTKQVGDVTKQVGDVKKQINVVDKKVEKMKSEVLYNTWKFVGRGQEQIYDDKVGKDHTTLKECLELCQTKRMSDGVEWNGVVWRVSSGRCFCEKNDIGHYEDANYLHYKAQ